MEFVDTKRCPKCGCDKPVSAFAKNASAKDGLTRTCRECHAEYTKDHYQANRQYYAQKARRREAEMRRLVVEAKGKPCADCGERYPFYVMDFDHRDTFDKEAEIGVMVRRGSLRRLLEEMQKCDVVCANCHRQRTHDRLAREAQLDERPATNREVG